MLGSETVLLWREWMLVRTSLSSIFEGLISSKIILQEAGSVAIVGFQNWNGFG